MAASPSKSNFCEQRVGCVVAIVAALREPAQYVPCRPRLPANLSPGADGMMSKGVLLANTRGRLFADNSAWGLGVAPGDLRHNRGVGDP